MSSAVRSVRSEEEDRRGCVALLCDRDGRPIGRVFEARQGRLVGRGAGTVLLVRRRPVRLREKAYFALA
jgi:hypothetical protein